MEKMKQYMKTRYHLSSYQIAQFFYLIRAFLSETSKILIMGILFHNQWKLYLFALLIMICIRSAMGGLHFYTYLGCLIASTVYVWLAMYVMPHIILPLYIQLPAIAGCIITCNQIGPIISKYRPEECKKQFQKCKRFVTVFLFGYALLLFIIPENPYLYVGFWVIILHSLQLIAAKIWRKGETTVCSNH